MNYPRSTSLGEVSGPKICRWEEIAPLLSKPWKPAFASGTGFTKQC
jgi:hypothetical protein